MATPRELIEEIECNVQLPAGSDERFNGYGVMGLPFRSGDVLAMRRFPATSLGPAYTSVWRRDPDGRWSMFQNVPPRQACPRYFGSALVEAGEREIQIGWPGPEALSITIPGELSWELSLASTPATRLMNAMSGLMPDALWRSPAVLRVMGLMAGPVLRAGVLRMAGRVPNGQRFIANPMRIWTIPAANATFRGAGLGPVGPAPEQGRLGDFYLPQRGIFAIGRAFFETFDAATHSAATSHV